MTGLKAQLNRKLHECGRDPLSLFLLGCVIAAALITFMVLSFLLGYILWQGLPNIETGLFALQYNSENVSLFPALVDTVLMVVMRWLLQLRLVYLRRSIWSNMPAAATGW